MLDGNGVKAMSGLIPAPNLGSSTIRKKENKGNQMGHTKNNFFMKNRVLLEKHSEVTHGAIKITYKQSSLYAVFLSSAN